MAQVYAQPVARKTMIVHPVAPPVITQRVARQRIAQPVARGEALQPVARYLQPCVEVRAIGKSSPRLHETILMSFAHSGLIELDAQQPYLPSSKEHSLTRAPSPG